MEFQPIPYNLFLFRFMINFALCFTMGKAQGVKDIPKMWGWTRLSHHRMLLILRMPLPGRAPYRVHFNFFFLISQITNYLGLSIDFDEKRLHVPWTG